MAEESASDEKREEKLRAEIERERLEFEKRKWEEETRIAREKEEKEREEARMIDKAHKENAAFDKKQLAAKAKGTAAKQGIKQNWFRGFLGSEKDYHFTNMMLMVGLILHIVSLFYGFARIPWLIYLNILIGILFIILFGMGDREKLRTVSIAVAIAVLFEYFYHDIINLVFPGATMPYFLSKAFWNGWIIVGAFAGFNESKISKVFAWVMFIFLVMNLFVYLPVEKYLGEQTKIEKVEVGGFKQTVGAYMDELKCSMRDPSEKTVCLKEAEWARKSKTEVDAMKETCATSIAECDCYVYAGKERDECFEEKSKYRAKQISGGEKEKTAMKVDFDAPSTSEALGTRVQLSPLFKILSPNKPVDIILDCKISYANGTSIERLLDNEAGTITLSSIKTDETFEYSRRFTCKSAAESVAVGTYTFNTTALISNINTKSIFTGIYTDPATLSAYIAKKNPTFEQELEDEKKTAYPKGRIESMSDPDLTLLNFVVEPLASFGVSGVSAFSKEGEYADFILIISLENNKVGSRIMDVESLEFLIPNIFTPMCGNAYMIGYQGDKIKISAKKEVLNRINFQRVTSTKSKTPISDLGCELKASGDLKDPTHPNPYDFEGSITYSQEVAEKFTVRRVV